jgi:hypothetical protein
MSALKEKVLERVLDEMLPKILNSLNESIVNSTIEINSAPTGDGGFAFEVIVHPKAAPPQGPPQGVA